MAEKIEVGVYFKDESGTLSVLQSFEVGKQDVYVCDDDGEESENVEEGRIFECTGCDEIITYRTWEDYDIDASSCCGEPMNRLDGVEGRLEGYYCWVCDKAPVSQESRWVCTIDGCDSDNIFEYEEEMRNHILASHVEDWAGHQ